MTVTGYVDEDELALRLAALDVGLCPYRDASASGSMSTLLGARPAHRGQRFRRSPGRDWPGRLAAEAITLVSVRGRGRIPSGAIVGAVDGRSPRRSASDPRARPAVTGRDRRAIPSTAARGGRLSRSGSRLSRADLFRSPRDPRPYRSAAARAEGVTMAISICGPGPGQAGEVRSQGPNRLRRRWYSDLGGGPLIRSDPRGDRGTGRAAARGWRRRPRLSSTARQRRPHWCRPDA